MIKVFKIKDIMKFIIKIVIPLIIILVIINLMNVKESVAVSGSDALLFCLKDSIPNIKMVKDDENVQTPQELANEIENSIEFATKNFHKYIISSEFTIMNDDITENKFEDEVIEDDENKFEDEIETDENNKIDVKQAETNVKVEVVENNVDPRTTNEYNGVKINNSTDYELTEDLLNPEGLVINKKKILIFHTHTCESYTPTEAFYYESSGNFRSNDLNFSVARVGDELESQLKSYGYEVIHDKTYHDYPSYNGSYSRSLETAQAILENNPDIDIAIDLHRDAIADSTYAPKVKIGDEYASQLMFVMGTDSAEGVHTNWRDNLKFAVKVQQKANELYNGLFKPIILRNSDYNQFITKAACIIEVGATGNTLEESMNAMKYLARIIEEM